MIKKNVLRLMPTLDYGGVESRVALQARLSLTEPYELSVATLRNAGAAAQEVQRTGLEFSCLDITHGPYHPDSVLSLIRFLNRTKPDLVHSSIVEANLPAALATSACGIPLIVEEVGQLQHSTRARLILGAAYRLSERAVAVSKVTESYMREQEFLGSTRVRQIYNCAHPDFFPRDRAPVSRRSSDSTHFVAVGRLHPIKNHEALIEAFAEPCAAPSRLTLVGDGPLENHLRERVRKLELSERVRLVGFAKNVRSLLQDADAFILPSHSEGCSISLIEAMATGLPVLGSNVPGIVEVMGRHHAARWTSPTDRTSISRLVEDFSRTTSEERTEAATHLQNRAYTMFSPEAYMGSLRDLYEEVLQAPPRSIFRRWLSS